jgi:hypothetical protein
LRNARIEPAPLPANPSIFVCCREDDLEPDVVDHGERGHGQRADQRARHQTGE